VPKAQTRMPACPSARPTRVLALLPSAGTGPCAVQIHFGNPLRRILIDLPRCGPRRTWRGRGILRLREPGLPRLLAPTAHRSI
jgi:hypothetical protein